MKKTLFIPIFLLMALPSLLAQSKSVLQFADPLQSNMVIQQNKPLKVWGRALAGKSVKITADWLSTETIVRADASGNFLGIIQVPQATENDFSKHQLIIESEGNSLTLQNVLIGDVWFCSGQSNMQFSMGEIKDSITENADTEYPNIRLFNAGLNFSVSPITTISGKWEESSPSTAVKFSAVGFTFGRALYKELNIPIGLVFSGIGASAAQAYVPLDALAADTLLNRVYLKPYLDSDKSKEIIDGGFSFEKVTRPFLLYNALINPFINLSVKGFCWYQGESNRKERESYTVLTQTMIKSWRENFAQGDLPFYYVQVAPYCDEKEVSGLADYAFFKEAQEYISQLNNTGMVLTVDVSDPKNLHPTNKKPVGIRLAKTALNRVYGKLEIAYKGPQYQYMEIEKNKAVIHFDKESIADGLQTNDGKAPDFFSIAGADKIFYQANATILNNTIVVSSSNVKKPVAVRYAFTNCPVTNLENNKELPAVPFRTDDWKEILVK